MLVVKWQVRVQKHKIPRPAEFRAQYVCACKVGEARRVTGSRNNKVSKRTQISPTGSALHHDDLRFNAFRPSESHFTMFSSPGLHVHNVGGIAGGRKPFSFDLGQAGRREGYNFEKDSKGEHLVGVGMFSFT